ISRSRKRWIFPVAVFGSSFTNTIQRGYLYAASRCFTKACNSSSNAGDATWPAASTTNASGLTSSSASAAPTTPASTTAGCSARALSTSAGLVHDHRVVPGYQCAARARADLAAPVRNECMAHLGRPDAVENLEPESLEPAVVNRLRQRLTRGQAEAHRPEVVQPFGVRDLEHRGEGGRYREEQGRPLARENLEHLCRLGAPGVEHGRGAHVEREIQGVAEPVGEEQPGHGEAAVVRADLQYVPPE